MYQGQDLRRLNLRPDCPCFQICPLCQLVSLCSFGGLSADVRHLSVSHSSLAFGLCEKKKEKQSRQKA